MSLKRRTLLGAVLPVALGPVLDAAPRLRITGFEMLPVRATERSVWLFIRLSTDRGITGLGEASDAFGFGNTSKADAQRLEAELRRFYSMVEGKSPLEIEAFRQKAMPVASAGRLLACTAASAMEQALWDVAGQALDVPVHQLLGGKVRDQLPVYANINRVTRPRTPEGFAGTAKRAVAEGFRAVKAAPFDGFPKLSAAQADLQKAADLGVACVAAIREAVGPEVHLMIDAHSFFDVPLALRIAERLERYKLAWFEEPIAPSRAEETLAIRMGIRQPMAGGEFLHGVKGFASLCHLQAVHIIMPDVKHCGGILEMTRIAGMAHGTGVKVAPHNPTGPVATAASIQACAGMANFDILELQWGEAGWRGDLVTPEERFVKGSIAVPDAPGLGIRLNEKLAKEHAL